MQQILIIIKNIITKPIIILWNIFSLFFGFPYEKQCDKLELEKYDKDIRGPDNEKPKYTVYRANKVSNEV
ncbi:hypothetical protein [Sulfurimonas sp.]|jgi:hypothetical protein|uniref:hypothetical protein n=1 Tax=Sulfurimonas sp. TaxID=2022749 RepID=UPI00260067B6|nr:hypothetical protein [Sulfurimonas sp.]MBT5935959.1 hypothetical protein [Sulfurimonas sp.]